MPVPWIGWQVAPVMQPPSPTAKNSKPGLQMTAQWLGVCEPGVSTTHCACAVVPAGTAGHGDDGEHDGEQNLPVTPVMETASSSAAHGPLFGSP